MTSLAQLAAVRRVQAQTKRIYSILYSERHENRATVKAGELVKAGAIGKVIQTLGVGPHRLNAGTRPQWFFDSARYGGILCDVGSHQFDQFLFFTGSTRAEIVAAQVGNVHHPEYPGLEDFGDVMLRGDGGTGYVRVDWFTPDGLNTWGDARLTVLGTEGYIEVRKNADIGGRPGGEHLLLVDKKETRYFDCKNEPLPYGERLVDDVLNRTETAMPQQHCFYATELALKAQKLARKLGRPATAPESLPPPPGPRRARIRGLGAGRSSLAPPSRRGAAGSLASARAVGATSHRTRAGSRAPPARAGQGARDFRARPGGHPGAGDRASFGRAQRPTLLQGGGVSSAGRWRARRPSTSPGLLSSRPAFAR